MPAVIPFIPLIAAGVGAGATVAGAKIASGGAKDAASTQAASADKALDFAKEKFNQQEANNQEYMRLGTGALGRLGYDMGFTGYENPNSPVLNQAKTVAHSVMTPPAPSVPAPNGFVQRLQSHNQPQPQGGGLVTLRAPTGETQQVPPEQVAFYQSHGAQVVQGAA